MGRVTGGVTGRAMGKRLFCILLVASLLATPSLAYAGEIGGGQGAGALDSPSGKAVTAVTQAAPFATQATPFATQAGAENAVSDEAYQDLGFQALPEQEAFTSDEHPLDG